MPLDKVDKIAVKRISKNQISWSSGKSISISKTNESKKMKKRKNQFIKTIRSGKKFQNQDRQLSGIVLSLSSSLVVNKIVVLPIPIPWGYRTLGQKNPSWVRPEHFRSSSKIVMQVNKNVVVSSSPSPWGSRTCLLCLSGALLRSSSSSFQATEIVCDAAKSEIVVEDPGR